DDLQTEWNRVRAAGIRLTASALFAEAQRIRTEGDAHFAALLEIEALDFSLLPLARRSDALSGQANDLTRAAEELEIGARVTGGNVHATGLDDLLDKAYSDAATAPPRIAAIAGWL